MKTFFNFRKLQIGIVIFGNFFVMLGCGAIADEIKIGGTGNALGTMILMGEAFTVKNPATKVVVLDSIGSSGAIKAVPKGAIDIGVSSRNLSDEERANGTKATEYARTVTVLAVSTKTKATAINSAQIADIFTGKLAKWPDGTPVRPVLRQPGDDNSKQLGSLSPEIEKALLAAAKRGGLASAVIDQEAANKIESIPGAVGLSTLALIKSEGRALRALKLDGVEPTVKNAASGAYPLIKHFFSSLSRSHRLRSNSSSHLLTRRPDKIS
jgi:phosphate transport system substrate-binding protein